MLGLSEKLSQVFLLEPAVLVLSSFEIVFVMFYVKKILFNVNSKMREKMINIKKLGLNRTLLNVITVFANNVSFKQINLTFTEGFTYQKLVG